MSITVEHLFKRYGTEMAVEDLSFEMKAGEVLGFLGPNGAGKSTTMKIITCYLAPTRGDVRLGPYSIHSDADAIKQRIGYLPEHNPLYTDMPVIDYLRFCAQIQGIRAKEAQQRVREMVVLCGLDQEKHKKIEELSKGYRQRVGLAQAMIHDPEVLVLDEPTSGLDPNQIREMRQIIKDMGKKKTIILSSHILPEVEATCDRILIINKGRIVADGTAESLRSKAKGKEILQIQLEAPTTEAQAALEKLQGVLTVRHEGSGRFVLETSDGARLRKAISALCREKDWDLLEMSGTAARLEDVFRELTLS